MVSFCRVMVWTLQAWRYSQDLHEGEGVHLLGIGSDLLRSNYVWIVTNQIMTPYTVYDEDITLNLKACILLYLIGLSTHCLAAYTWGA